MKKYCFLLLVLVLIFACKSDNETTTDDKVDKVEKTDEAVDKNNDTKVDKEQEKVEEEKASAEEEKYIDVRMKFELHDNIDKNLLKKHMEDLFNAIEEKIANGDFNGWYNALSKKYKRHVSDKTNLASISRRSEYLSQKKIVLKSAEDYFRQVVVKAREGIPLRFHNYKYIDKNHVKVISVLDGSQEFVYNFINESGYWKLDL